MGKRTGVGATLAVLAMITPLGILGWRAEEPRSIRIERAKPSAPTVPALPVTVTVTPTAGATRQPVSTEIGTAVTGGRVTDVSVSLAGGREVAGAMSEDGSSWIPAAPLKYASTYTAQVTATGPTGQVTTRTTMFSTMARPTATVRSVLYLRDGRTYGVAMPVVVSFSPGIPRKDRAAVQRRMFVRTNPPQPGVWHWLADGTQAYYRAPRYWQPHTTLRVRIALTGIPFSNGRYGDMDRKATSRIGQRFEMKISDPAKRMSVYENGRLIRTVPVSLGKKSTPSSSGVSVVMEKLASTVFDTRDDPNPANRYVTRVAWAQRLTWGGEFVHAAPWSVGQQGRTNVSHGCVNVSTANARWLFSRSQIGDPVTVTGTGTRLRPGNGWTAWNMSWGEFIAGSALPVTTIPARPDATGSSASSGTPAG